MNTIAVIIAIVALAAIVWGATRKSKSDTGTITPGTGPVKSNDPGTGPSPGKEIR